MVVNTQAYWEATTPPEQWDIYLVTGVIVIIDPETTMRMKTETDIFHVETVALASMRNIDPNKREGKNFRT